MPEGTAPQGARGSDLSGSPNSNMEPYNYSLLIKPTSKFVSRDEDFRAIQAGLLNLQKRLDISNIVLEEGKHRCHFHATLTFHRKSMYAKKYQQKGIYIGIKPLREPRKYRTYCRKEASDYYAKHYGFGESTP